MQRLIQRIQQQLQAFVDQRDDLMLVASCSDVDTAFVLQILRGIEQATEDDVFILFGHPFEDVDSWALGCITQLQEELSIANQWLEEEQAEPLPGLPTKVLDQTRPGAQRLVDAMMFVRSVIPLEGGRRLIWVMTPFSIKDRAAYLQMVASFVPTQEILPWMRQGIRLVVRDEAHSTLTAPRTRVLAVDLGPEAMEAALEEDVMDESLPAEERMQALMMSAMQDYGHGRRDDALAKNELLLGHYQGTNDMAMQALVLSNIGDIHRKDGELEQAQSWYECAVPPAVSGENPVIFHTVVKNLADVVYERENYPMAEECYTDADQLAGALCDADAKVRALEGQGLSREKQGGLEGAAESWEGAATLCRSLGDMEVLLRPNLEHLARVYGQLGDSRKLDAVKEELHKLHGQEVAG